DSRRQRLRGHLSQRLAQHARGLEDWFCFQRRRLVCWRSILENLPLSRTLMRTKQSDQVRVQYCEEYYRVVARDHAYYEAFPQHWNFNTSKRKYRLLGGAAGPGKTMALLYEGIRQAQWVPGSDSLLLRRTYPELESSLLAFFRRDVPRDLYRRYNEAKH